MTITQMEIASQSLSAWGIVVAAGSGTRFGGDKHLATLGGIPLWRWADRLFADVGLDGVILVGDVPGGIRGGVRRQDSVAAGLAAIPNSAEIVLVHDAARPLASARLVGRLLEAVVAGDVDGAVPAVPLRDTIKLVQGQRIKETIDRSDLVAVQTPQAFRGEILRTAHIQITADVTDDAAMVEAMGGSVVVVDGDPSNIKVTFAADLAMAESLLTEESRR